MEAWTPNLSLRRHMLAVEAAMRAYATHLGEDVERWGLAGLLHDFDYERFPNDAQAADAEHPSEGVRHLRTLGYPEDICQAILGHAPFTGVARESQMAKALFAVDELCGLITAAALVRPSKSVMDLEASSPGGRRERCDRARRRTRGAHHLRDRGDAWDRAHPRARGTHCSLTPALCPLPPGGVSAGTPQRRPPLRRM